MAACATFRPAAKADASALAVLVDIAGEGLPAYLWSTLKAPGQSILELGRERAARERKGAGVPVEVIVLPGTAGPMPWDVHGVVQHTQDVDAIFRLIDHVQNEVTRGPAALRDVEEPPVGR